MMTFVFAKKHSTNNPPPGVVSGTFSADPGDYDIKVTKASDNSDFTETKSVTVPGTGAVDVNLQILECSTDHSKTLKVVNAVACGRKKGETSFKQCAIKTINYTCA